MKKTKPLFVMPTFSWEVPIEQELLRWARHMKRSNQSYIANTIWGNRQKREAGIYANVFEMVEKRILREMEFRHVITDKTTSL